MAANMMMTLPEVVLTIGAILLMLVSAWGGAKSTRAVSWTAVAVLAGAGVALLGPASAGGEAYDGLYRADAFAAFAKALIYIATAASIVIAPGFFARTAGDDLRPEYPVLMLLAAVEKELGIADRLAPLITDPRNPLLVTHSVADILRARMLAIACGYEDADDLDHLRTDPAFKLACNRLPDSGGDLCSQPTVSRWENAPTLREVVRMTYAMIDLYCASYARPPAAVTLDIDDTPDIVHGH